MKRYRIVIEVPGDLIADLLRASGRVGVAGRSAYPPASRRARKPAWISLSEAAMRSGKNQGHLRNRCKRWVVQGLARKVAGYTGHAASHPWEVSTAADPRFKGPSRPVRRRVKARSNGDNSAV